MLLRTPKYNLREHPNVYEPSEDSFLFLDALEHEMEFLRRLQPKFAVEIGSGSGIVVTALTSVVNDCVYFATDVNPDACDATVETAELNGAAVSCVQMNLLSNFRDKFFDVVLFNPPYVVTDPSETVGRGLNRAWAGGLQGRQITNQVLHNLNTSLSEKGVCYMVLLKENNIDEIASLMCKNKFRTEIVIERKIRGEHLYVAKFSRIS
jgi:release factor glutamine methyltransferase